MQMAPQKGLGQSTRVHPAMTTFVSKKCIRNVMVAGCFQKEKLKQNTSFISFSFSDGPSMMQRTVDKHWYQTVSLLSKYFIIFPDYSRLLICHAEETQLFTSGLLQNSNKNSG